MTVWLIDKPRWFVCTVEGIAFGVLVALLGFLQQNSWAQVILGGAFGGVLFGVVLGFRTAAAHERLLEVSGRLAPDQRLAAVRIAIRKTSPARNPMIMRAAYKVAVFRRDQAVRQYRLTLIVFGVLLFISVAATVAFSAAFTLLAAICLVSLIIWVRRPQRLQQRVDALTPVSSPPGRGRKGKQR